MVPRAVMLDAEHVLHIIISFLFGGGQTGLVCFHDGGFNPIDTGKARSPGS